MVNPARCAFDLRATLTIPTSQPIGDIVDLITKGCGYKYTEESFGNSFSAFSQSLGSGDFLICFNTDHDRGEPFKRYSLAHELGHLSIPTHQQILLNQKPHYSRAEYGSRDEIEREADAFAINFLAPAAPFSKVVGMKQFIPDDIAKISAHFGISRYAGAKRFLELIDLCCTMMVCDEHGHVEYESRSETMKQMYRNPFLPFVSNVDAPGSSLVHDWVAGNQAVKNVKVRLNDWFPQLPIEVDASEFMIDLKYNKKYLVLITPDIADIDAHAAEEDY